MNLSIPLDTESTGIPDWKIPSDDPTQPHLVQLAAHQVDLDTFEIHQSMDVIIRPEGWEIPQVTVDVHGITFEKAMDVGISEKLAVEMFLDLWNGSHRIAFNTTFDNRIIRIATKRYFPEDVQTRWKEGEYFCTMINARKIMGGKVPTLAEAYKYFTGKEMVNAHQAMADNNASWEIYKAIKKLELAA